MLRSIFISIILLGGVVFTPPAFASSVVAKSTLTRGTEITLDDIDIDTKSESEFDALSSQFVGMSVIRTIAGGTTLKERDVAAPIKVRRNSRVKMMYKFGRLEISATGRALSEGREGDIITVMNLESRKRVEGRVTSFGTVEMIP